MILFSNMRFIVMFVTAVCVLFLGHLSLAFFSFTQFFVFCMVDYYMAR